MKKIVLLICLLILSCTSTKVSPFKNSDELNFKESSNTVNVVYYTELNDRIELKTNDNFKTGLLITDRGSILVKRTAMDTSRKILISNDKLVSIEFDDDSGLLTVNHDNYMLYNKPLIENIYIGPDGIKFYLYHYPNYEVTYFKFNDLLRKLIKVDSKNGPFFKDKDGIVKLDLFNEVPKLTLKGLGTMEIEKIK